MGPLLVIILGYASATLVPWVCVKKLTTPTLDAPLATGASYLLRIFCLLITNPIFI